MKLLKVIGFVILLMFAAIGLLFSSVFVAMQFGWLNVRGSIDARNNSIIEVLTDDAMNFVLNRNETQILIATGTSPEPTSPDFSCLDEGESCLWLDTYEWKTVAGGLIKDLEIIKRVSEQTGVSPRMIAAVVVPEQIRFFTSNREVFKRYFEPLKILGSLSKFSLGVSGIKQDAAEAVEAHANDPFSAFYPGESYAALLAYELDADKSNELFNRLTNEKDHYYSYLYTAVYIKEIISQWERAGYDIIDQPEIVATLFNLGFSHSKPNDNPQVGGATISIGGSGYSFGRLAGLFYRSAELPQLEK